MQKKYETRECMEKIGNDYNDILSNADIDVENICMYESTVSREDQKKLFALMVEMLADEVYVQEEDNEKRLFITIKEFPGYLFNVSSTQILGNYLSFGGGTWSYEHHSEDAANSFIFLRRITSELVLKYQKSDDITGLLEAAAMEIIRIFRPIIQKYEKVSTREEEKLKKIKEKSEKLSAYTKTRI